ncbi:Ras domain-containing protein [Rhizoctonia solani AG-1 IA]|uniref:Ras domain-containing protein n=1 Tax=Thanatephorus cucumeris (strain AG1-IA) TaxID=983506 RepID=L8WMU3_THACA|nr:Ras domain-containing protein [Rhizoctonia solani AG-1 IA]
MSAAGSPRTIKLVIIGDSGVGKVRHEYITGRFSTAYRATIGADFIAKRLPHYSKPEQGVVIQIWDTAGQEKFSGLSSAFFRGADAALFMFDATRPDSVSDLRRWWNEFAAKRPVLEGSEAEFCAVFVGNKVDLLADQERRVNGPSDTEDRAHDWTEPNGGHPPIADKLVNQFLQDLIPTKFDLITTPASSRRRTIDVDKLSQGISLPPPEDDTSGPTRTPGKPYLEPTDAEHEPESPPRSSSRSRSIGIPSSSSRPPWLRSKPRGLNREGNGTATTNQTIFHTPATSLFRTTSPTSPSRSTSPANSQLRHGGSSLLSMETARSHFSSSSTPIQPPPSRSVSHSSSIVSVVTIKPAQRPGSPPGEGILESPQLPEAGNNLLEIGPKLFWSSARTGEGVASVFEYVAHRVIQRWEWEESQLGFEEGIEDDGGPTAQRLRDDWGKGKRSWRAACC